MASQRELEEENARLRAALAALTADAIPAVPDRVELEPALGSRSHGLVPDPRELHDSERLYRAIGESIDFGVWVCAPDGRNTYASESLLKLLGITQAQCSDFGWGDALHPEDAARTIEAWKECVRTEGTWDIEHRFRGMDGEWHHVLARGVPVKNARGEVICWAGINLDIDRQKRTEAELQRSLKRFALLADVAGSLLRASDSQKVIESICLRVMEHLDCHSFFNFLIDEETGRLRLSACAGIPAEQRRELAQLELGVAVCGCVARDGRRIVAENLPDSGDERTRLVESLGIRAYACHPLLGPGEKVIGTLSFGTRGRSRFSADDLSLMEAVADQVAVALIRSSGERERARNLAAIQEANEAKDLFLNTLSHELRTPLAAMFNAVEVLKSPRASSGQRERVLELLERNVRHQSRLIDDLLDLARIMRRKVEIAHERLDLRELVASQVDTLEGSLRDGRLSISIDAAPSPVIVSGDSVRLGQVISNLLTNAAKFTPPGGAIRVTVSSADGAAIVRVKDSGIGISPELLPHIFVPFRQGEAGLASSRSGLGIGLAVARSLTELHGGTLEAASGGVGLGAELTLRLPRLLEGATDEPARARPGSGRSRRVLVVEDNADLRESLVTLLTLLGHVTLQASDGKTAIELARSERPEVALVDIGLPDMRGYEVARALRAEPSLGELRLVALTGYATSIHRDQAMSSGFDHHLAKPVDVADLERVLL